MQQPIQQMMQNNARPPGYNPYEPVGCKNIIAFGDSAVPGQGDVITKGGWVNRVITASIAAFGPAADLLKWRGTTPVRGYLTTASTEGHGGLEWKVDIGSLAKGAAVDNVVQALLNKPIRGVDPEPPLMGTGQTMFGMSGWHRNVALAIWAPGAGNVNNYSESPEFVKDMMLESLVLCRQLLNEADYNAKIAFAPDLWDWGGNTELAQSVNHQRVLDIRAQLPTMISQFEAQFPDQPLITGIDCYDCLGLWSTPTPFQFGWDNPTVPGQFGDIVHPNELGYDMLSTTPASGIGFVDFLMPVFQELLGL